MNKDSNDHRKILITGAKGALGIQLHKLLLKNSQNDIILFEGDVTSKDDISNFFEKNRNIDVLFHLAAIVPVNKVEKQKLKAIDVNMTGSAFIAQSYAEKNPNGHLIHVSSSHVYKPSPSPLKEKAVLEPSTFYGLTKLLAENAVTSICQFYSLKYSLVRVFSMWDENQPDTFLFGNLKKRLKNHFPEKSFELYGAKSIRNFSHTSEVAVYLVKVLEHKILGPVNVGNKNNMTVAEYAEQLYGEKLKIYSKGKNNHLIPSLQKFFKNR